MPSTVSLITAGIGLFCVLVVFLALVFLANRESKINVRLQQEGAVVEGIVVDSKRTFVPRAVVRFTLTYQYRYGGATYEYTQNVRRSLYEAAYAGMKIAVRCLPEDPAIVRIASDLLP